MVLPDVTVEFNFHGGGNYSTTAQKQALFISEDQIGRSLGLPSRHRSAAFRLQKRGIILRRQQGRYALLKFHVSAA
jgi:predicted transcriptional regulator of viral defense system